MDRLEFDEFLYRTLRDYQDGKFNDKSVAVGKLTPELTAVYDKLREVARPAALEVALEALRHYADESGEKVWGHSRYSLGIADTYRPMRNGYDIAREALAKIGEGE